MEQRRAEDRREFPTIQLHRFHSDIAIIPANASIRDCSGFLDDPSRLDRIIYRPRLPKLQISDQARRFP
jgi:hypothetical protein